MRILSFLYLLALTGCAGMPAMWNHASPEMTVYNEVGVSRGFEPNPAKIEDPALKTKTPAGVQYGGTYMFQMQHFVTKVHSDPATSFWLGLATTSNARTWGFTIGFDFSITPWPQELELKYDELEGLLGVEYPIVIRREGRFSAFALPMQFELRPSKYFVPIFAFTPVTTGVSSSSTVEMVEPFDKALEFDPILRSNLDARRRHEASKDKGGRYLLVGGLGVRSQIGPYNLKFLYVDRRLDSKHLNDNFQQMFQFTVGMMTGSKVGSNRPVTRPQPSKPASEPTTVPGKTPPSPDAKTPPSPNAKTPPGPNRKTPPGGR